MVAKAPAVTKKVAVAVKASAAAKEQTDVKAIVAKVKTDFVTIAKTKCSLNDAREFFLQGNAGD